MSVIGQECFDASLWDQLATQCCRIEQLRIGFALSLHLPILDDPDSNREYQVGFFQQASSGWVSDGLGSLRTVAVEAGIQHHGATGV